MEQSGRKPPHLQPASVSCIRLPETRDGKERVDWAVTVRSLLLERLPGDELRSRSGGTYAANSAIAASNSRRRIHRPISSAGRGWFR
jgi:hypothetical protein